MQASVKQEYKGARSTAETIERAYSFAPLSNYSLRHRLLIKAADLAFFLLINLICRTMRFEVEGWENWESVKANGRLPIYSFWHNRVFATTYFWRNRGIVVMTSQSFDGEYIARFIQRFGYGAARGSSTRGGTGAMVEMVRLMRNRCQAAFTIDGPKGPPFVAKMGSVLLAKKTGHPVLPVTLTPRSYWEVNSWDRFQVPWPFTRALVIVAPPIHVAGDASEEQLTQKRDELQQALDDINRRGEQWKQIKSPKPKV